MARPYAAFGAGSAKKHRPAVKPAPVVAKYNRACAIVSSTQHFTRQRGLPVSMQKDYSDKKTPHGRDLRKTRAAEVRKANYFR